MIADMAMNIEVAKRMIYTTTEYIGCGRAGKGLATFAAMSKCFASDMAMKVTTDAVQILGGYGICNEYSMQRYLRDALQIQFSPISNEMSRNMLMQFQGLPKSWA